jgi:hypothetical protein
MVSDLKRFSTIAFFGVFFIWGLCSAKADSFTFTASTHTYGSATFTATPGSNTIVVTLTNSLLNQSDISQAISGISFQVTNAQGTVINMAPISILSQSGREVAYKSKSATKAYDLNGTSAPDPMGWQSTIQTAPIGNSSPSIKLSGLGSTGPDETIWGVPTSSTSTYVVYANANSSMKNAPHQPGVVQTANLTLQLGNNLVPGFYISNVVMYFGTADIPEFMVIRPPVIPEPSTLVLLCSGLLVAGCLVYRRKVASS